MSLRPTRTSRSHRLHHSPAPIAATIALETIGPMPGKRSGGALVVLKSVSALTGKARIIRQDDAYASARILQLLIERFGPRLLD
jgi:hypothetical protein